MTVEPQLLYIAAWGRSGSTILGNIIGALPGVFDAGELRHFWGRLGQEDFLCGCGASLAVCPFWREVGSELFNDAEMPTRDLAVVRGWQREATRTRKTARVIRSSALAGLPTDPFDYFVTALRCLYRAIARVSGADVIVDSSKKTSYGSLLRFVSEAPPVYVHLVRDPRAVAYSWSRVRKSDPSGDRQMPRHGAAKSSLNWVTCNLGGERLRRTDESATLLVRYESFMQTPRTTVSQIQAQLGRRSEESLFVDDHTVTLPPNHALAGNPSRFRHGVTSLSSDDEWAWNQRRTDRLVCNLVTFPLLRRYGYGLRVK